MSFSLPQCDGLQSTAQLSVLDLVRESALERMNSLAVSDGLESLTYAELLAAIESALAWLRSTDISAGSRVGLIGGKSVQYIATLLAILGSGLIAVPIAPNLRSRQISHVIRDCQPALLISDKDRAAELRQALGPETQLTTFDALKRSASAPLNSWQPQTEKQPCCILYTSGSTGNAKGIVLSHRNLVAGTLSVRSYTGVQPREVVLGLLPLSFDAGLNQLFVALASGAHYVGTDYLLPHDVSRTCKRYGVTYLTAVPPLWMQLASVRWGSETLDVRVLASTGGRMPQPVLERLSVIFPNSAVYLMYGLTEAFRSTYLPPSLVKTKPTSIGKAIPNADVRVVRQDGTECDAGEVGELVHRGPTVALGYWGHADLTEKKFRRVSEVLGDLPSLEREVWSGDLVSKDAEGFLYYHGRADEMIKSMGYRISPTEIEEAIHASGLAREVVAFGVTDETRGQAVVAYVVPASRSHGIDALKTFCGRNLPTHMCPTTFVVREQLDRGPTGKFDRISLREEFEAIHGRGG